MDFSFSVDRLQEKYRHEYEISGEPVGILASIDAKKNDTRVIRRYKRALPRRADTRLLLRARNGRGCRQIEAVNATVLTRGALRKFHGSVRLSRKGQKQVVHPAPYTELQELLG